MSQVLIDLAQKVHPLVLGQIFRTQGQIQYLARRLLNYQVKDVKKQKRIIDFLASDSGSHDYTVNRREASQLGLNTEKPDAELYQLIKNFYGTVRDELELETPFDFRSLVAQADSAPYACTRCLIESIEGGSHIHTSEGIVTKIQVPVQAGIIRKTQFGMNDILKAGNPDDGRKNPKR